MHDTMLHTYLARAVRAVMHNFKLFVLRGVFGQLVQVGAARQEEHEVWDVSCKAVIDVLEIVGLHSTEVEDVIIAVLRT